MKHVDFPPSASAVEQLFRDYHAIRDGISPDAVSDLVALDTHFRKLFVLTAASHLEALMSFHMNEHFLPLGQEVHEFVRRFALDRMFFKWFDFEASLPKRLFRNFGEDCEARYAVALEDASFEESARRFLEICRTRNEMVHGNLATFTFETTAQELEANFRSAREFPDLAMRIIRPPG